MRSSRLLSCVFAFWWCVQFVQAEEENVALRKPVLAAARWKECLTDGKLWNSVIAPDAVHYPFYAVDLGALYNLTEIKVYAQDQRTFYNQGIGEDFNVSTYGEFTPACELHLKNWDELATNIRFKKTGESIVLKPTKLVQYIIIWRTFPSFPERAQPIIMGELMAFGEKVRDTKPEIPEDDEPAENYFRITRRVVIGNQQNLRVEQQYGAWQPNFTLMDVPFGWHHNRINAMAVTRENGRIIVIEGEQFVSRLMGDADYQPLRESFRAWLSPGVNNSLFRKVSANYREKDMIIITRRDQFDVEKIYNQIISGQNAAIIGYVAKDQTDNATTLIQKLGINFYRHDGYYGPRDIPLQDKINSNEYIPLSSVLQRYIDSWKVFRTESFGGWFSWEEWDSAEVQAQLKKIIAKYGRLMESLAPCEIQAYKRDPETVTALLNYNALLNRQNGDRITPLPGVQRNPGTIDDKVNPTTVTVTVNSDLPGSFYPTGAYAKPGEGFRWKVLNTTRPDFKSMFIRINAQTDGVGHKGEMQRWPAVASRREMTEVGQWASAHGGPIFLDLDRNINVTIQFENVYRHAYVDLRDPKSIESFGSKLQEHKAVPWFIVMGDSMYSMLHMRSTVGRSIQDIMNSATFFDNCIKMMHTYQGYLYEKARPQVFVADVQISAGWGHSGYPWMGHLPWSDSFTEWNEIKKRGHWGFIHEIGHNLQVGPATLKSGGEVTNNVFILPTTHFLLGKRNDILNEGDVYTDGHIGTMIEERWKRSDYEGPTLGYYAHLTALFGEGLIGNIFVKARANSGQLRSEDDKTQFWVKQVCNETGYDMVPYHQISRFPMNNETVAFCQQFTCFMPDDEITRRLPERVNEVLTAYGRNCTRSGQHKVQFNGEIMRGVNKPRPQVVFIQ